jgi:hypothetical protein
VEEAYTMIACLQNLAKSGRLIGNKIFTVKYNCRLGLPLLPVISTIEKLFQLDLLNTERVILVMSTTEWLTTWLPFAIRAEFKCQVILLGFVIDATVRDGIDYCQLFRTTI